MKVPLRLFITCKLTTCWFLTWQKNIWDDHDLYLPSLLFVIYFSHLNNDLSAPISGVATCNTSWDILGRMGLNPERMSIFAQVWGHARARTRVCVYVCTCSAWWDSHVACHPLVIILFWEFIQVLLQQLPHLSPPTLSVCLYKVGVQFVPNLIDIRLQASSTCAYILMKPWSHLFSSWFTLQSS